MPERFDLVILGSGSTAFAAARSAAELGKTAVMTESRTLGGTCVNRGCLPSKNLIEAARIVWEAQHPRYPGLRPCTIEVDLKELVRQKDEVVHDYRDRKYHSIVEDADKIKVFDGHAAFVSERTVSVDGRVIEGDQFLIATGTRPSVPPIEGLDQVPYLTSDLLTADEPQELFDLPKSLVIIGGGYIALELGQMFHRFGTEVTILERSRAILKDYEPEGLPGAHPDPARGGREPGHGAAGAARLPGGEPRGCGRPEGRRRATLPGRSAAGGDRPGAEHG
jgi:mercuric reductase